MHPTKMLGFKRIAFSIAKNNIHISNRTLFSERALTLEGFRKARLNFRIIKNDDHLHYEIQNSSIPTLVNSTKLWTLATSKIDTHIDLLRQSLTRIYANTSEIQTLKDINNLHHLGPMTMNTFYHLDLPEKALEFYYEFNNEYFDSNRTTLILMDLLFQHDRHNDILDVYRIRLAERQREPTFTHRICFNAACYKLNTPEAFQYALNEWDEHKSAASLHFVAMLAFNQKKFELALRLLGDKDFLSAINIKLLAMSALNDWKGVCDLLYKIKINRSIDKNYRISTEVFQKIRQSLVLSRPNLSTYEWDRCHRILVQIQHLNELILIPKIMDDILCSTINLKHARPQPEEDHQYAYYA